MVLTVPTELPSDVHYSSVELDAANWRRAGGHFAKTDRFVRDGTTRNAFFTNLSRDASQGYSRERLPAFLPRNTNTCPNVHTQLYDLDVTSVAGQMRRHKNAVSGVTSPAHRFRSHKVLTSNETRVPVMVDGYDGGRIAKGLLGPGAYEGADPRMGPARAFSPEARGSPCKDPTRPSWAFSRPARGDVFKARTGPPEDLQQLRKLRQGWSKTNARDIYSSERSISPVTWRKGNCGRFTQIDEVPEPLMNGYGVGPTGRVPSSVCSTPGPPMIAGMPVLANTVFKDGQGRLQALPRERRVDARYVRGKYDPGDVYETSSNLGPGAYLSESLPADYTYSIRTGGPGGGRSPESRHGAAASEHGSPSSIGTSGRPRGLATRWFYGDAGHLHTMGRAASSQGYRTVSSFA